MSGKVKTLIIAASALVILGVVLAVILLNDAPWEKEPENSGESISNILDFLDDDEDNILILLNRSADEVLKLTVQNENGGYTFDRKQRGEEYYWETDALGEVAPDEAAMRRFVGYLATLSGTALVEENVSGDALEKYGLKTPAVTAELSFEDGTSVMFSFGIRNPSKTEYVYCIIDGAEADINGSVVQTDYLTVMNAFHDARSFAQLTMTEKRESGVTGQPEYVRIQREDIGTPVEIRYMSELDLAEEDESIVITTSNTYRFVEPIRAELDASRASWLYNGLCGLSMDACEFLEKSEENMKSCGLDAPFARVEFKYNGEVRVMLLGREFTKTTDTSTNQSYYAVFEDTPGIFSLRKNTARWATFTIFGSVSNRPVSPYIYSCESVELTTPDKSFRFDIDGEKKTFSFGGKSVDGTEFRKLYQKLIGSVGYELYTEPTDVKPTVIVKFNYKSEYSEIYGGLSDELSYYKFDSRRYVVALNGNALFKVNAVYVDDLIESVNELVNY